MTPSEVYTIIRNQCGESATDFWSESEIYSLMAVAERIIARRCGILETNSAFTSVTGTKTYGIASYISSVVSKINRVEYDSYRLEGIGLNDIDDIEGMAYGGVTVSGSPEYYYRYGNTIGFSPTPDDAKEVKVYFNAVPDVITTASTAFSIPDDYSDMIPDYCLYRMFLKDQELRNEALMYQKQWFDNLSDIINENSSRRKGDSVTTVVVNNPLFDVEE